MLKSFSKTSPENSGGAENSAEISGTNGINFFCYMYESSLRHPVWVQKINVKACNRVASKKFKRDTMKVHFITIRRRKNYFCFTVDAKM